MLSKEGATVIAADKNYEAAVQTIKTYTAMASGSNGDVAKLYLSLVPTISVQKKYIDHNKIDLAKIHKINFGSKLLLL